MITRYDFENQDIPSVEEGKDNTTTAKGAFVMSLLAEMIRRGYSHDSAMGAKNDEHFQDDDMTERMEKEQEIDAVELYIQTDGSVGHGSYEQGRGIKIIERDYDGDALTWYGHQHWDDC